MSDLTRAMLAKYFGTLYADYVEHRKAQIASTEALYQGGSWLKIGVGADCSVVPEPRSSCPRHRVVAEPCAQGVRLKRYEQVFGMAELVLVSVEIVKT